MELYSEFILPSSGAVSQSHREVAHLQTYGSTMGLQIGPLQGSRGMALGVDESEQEVPLKGSRSFISRRVGHVSYHVMHSVLCASAGSSQLGCPAHICLAATKGSYGQCHGSRLLITSTIIFPTT